jgi:hypothetical protein
MRAADFPYCFRMRSSMARRRARSSSTSIPVAGSNIRIDLSHVMTSAFMFRYGYSSIGHPITPLFKEVTTGTWPRLPHPAFALGLCH